MFCISCFFSCSWLKEWKLRTDREERKKQVEKKREEGSNGGRLFTTTSTDLVCVCFYLTVALCVQTQTGTVERRTSRMERTCAIQCSSPDPRESERRPQSMLVLRSWVSRCEAVNLHSCDTC